MIQFEKHYGSDIKNIVAPLAHLRVTVFREYPYLYEGTLAYEEKYLQTYINSDRSLVVLAKSSDGEVIGATTCLPMDHEETALQGNFREQGYDPSQIFYFGESVVLPQHRGAGLGKQFFDFREEHARSFGTYRYTTFCGVVRPDDHPFRPASFKSPQTLWERLGYRKLDGIVAYYAWKDLYEKEETRKKMQFWIKEI
jgi:GNAT superfamily N-acetyltransferase